MWRKGSGVSVVGSAMTAAVMVGGLVWAGLGQRDRRLTMLTDVGQRNHDDSADTVLPQESTILALLIAAVRQGSSIPRALDAVGDAVGGSLGEGLCKVATALLRGVAWHDAWRSAGSESVLDDDSGQVDGYEHALFELLEESLEPSWRSGVSPVARLEATLERIDADERAQIEQAAGKLSVRLLMPTGLCLLPAFILIGVVPTVASFMS